METFLWWLWANWSRTQILKNVPYWPGIIKQVCFSFKVSNRPHLKMTLLTLICWRWMSKPCLAQTIRLIGVKTPSRNLLLWLPYTHSTKFLTRSTSWTIENYDLIQHYHQILNFSTFFFLPKVIIFLFQFSFERRYIWTKIWCFPDIFYGNYFQ